VEKTSVAWFASHSPVISAISTAACPAGSSDWMTSMAAGVAVEAHLGDVLDGVDGRPVHELEHRRAQPAGDVEDGAGRVVQGRRWRRA
jgi:hypothetical protein